VGVNLGGSEVCKREKKLNVAGVSTDGGFVEGPAAELSDDTSALRSAAFSSETSAAGGAVASCGSAGRCPSFSSSFCA
jgi:hypothetical protein